MVARHRPTESSQLRITFLLPAANLSGGARVVAIYARELTRRGHTVSVVSPSLSPISYKAKLKRWASGGGWIVEADRQKSHLDDSGVDHRVLESCRPIRDEDVSDGDIVIATWWETAEWANALSPRKGAKVYFIQHHEVFKYLPVDRSRATYRLPFHKIVIAKWLERLMIQEYGDEETDLVPNSVDRAQFFASVRTKQKAPTIGFLYAPAEFKGLDVCLEAIRRVRECLPDLRVLTFGTFRPTRALPLVEGAEFYHSPPQDQIRNIYDRCDVWLTASRSEGFNLPAMEAMACRTPVVSTRTGWPEEAIRQGWNGWLADVDDTDELVRGVEWILSRDEEAWEKLSENAFATVAATSWAASAELFERALLRARERAARGEVSGGA